MHAYWYLAIAIVSEVIATCSLSFAAGFTRLWPSLLVIIGYGIAFYCLSIVIKTVPVSLAYAIWTGCGILLVTLISFLWMKQRIDAAALAGIFFILVGVSLIFLFSKSAALH